MVLAAGTACRPRIWTSSPTELRTAAEVRALSRERAKEGLPVRLRGTITLTEVAGASLTIQDATGGIPLDRSITAFTLYAGQNVEVTGFTGQGNIFPVILNPSVRDLGQGKLPAARPVSIQTLETGKQDFQLVELTGIVRTLTATPSGRGVMDLVAEGRHVKIDIERLGVRNANAFTDARVKLSAVPMTSFDIRNQPVRTQLWMNSLDAVSTIEAAPADPFAKPLHSVASLRRLNPAADGHRLKLAGTVAAACTGGLLLRDDSGEICVQTVPGTPAMALGEHIEVAGFPPVESGRSILENAICRRADQTGREGPPAAGLPVLTNVAAIRSLAFDEAKRAYPVRLRATVTFVDSSWWGIVFVQDDTAGMFADVSGNKNRLPVRAGDL
ncbi:MAG: hypothetical protein ABSG25_08430, partial [Bryobacteraceae bacterium]